MLLGGLITIDGCSVRTVICYLGGHEKCIILRSTMNLRDNANSAATKDITHQKPFMNPGTLVHWQGLTEETLKY